MTIPADTPATVAELRRELAAAQENKSEIFLELTKTQERIAELEKCAGALVAAMRCAPMSWPRKQLDELRKLLEGK